MSKEKGLLIALVAVSLLAAASLALLGFKFIFANSGSPNEDFFSSPNFVNENFWSIDGKLVFIKSAEVHNSAQLEAFMAEHPETCVVENPQITFVTDDEERCEHYKSDDFMNSSGPFAASVESLNSDNQTVIYRDDFFNGDGLTNVVDDDGNAKAIFFMVGNTPVMLADSVFPNQVLNQYQLDRYVNSHENIEFIELDGHNFATDINSIKKKLKTGDIKYVILDATYSEIAAN